MKIKTCDLIGAQLDWAVCTAGGGAKDIRNWISGYCGYNMYHYSTDWSQGGPIIERERILFQGNPGAYHAWIPANPSPFGDGPTHLIAAMRCYVSSKFGDKIEIPEELK